MFLNVLKLPLNTIVSRANQSCRVLHWQALKMEGYHHLQPPCNSDYPTNPTCQYPKLLGLYATPGRAIFFAFHCAFPEGQCWNEPYSGTRYVILFQGSASACNPSTSHLGVPVYTLKKGIKHRRLCVVVYELSRTHENSLHVEIHSPQNWYTLW